MIKPRKSRILIVHDHALFRQGLISLLQRERDMGVIGEASDGVEAVEKAASLKPDVVLMDLGLARMNGIEATRKILERSPGIKVVALGDQKNEEHARAALEAGASGYILKDSAFPDLVQAIHVALEGGACLDPLISSQIIEDLRRSGGHSAAGAPVRMTPREREILRLIAEGRTNKEVARELGISDKTVMTHRTSMMKKLGVHNVAGLVRYAIARGIVSEGDGPV